MKNQLWTLGLVAATASLIAPAAQAADVAAALEQSKAYSDEAAVVSMDQVTSVSQLSDVKPTDWAFQALQSLVERYGCIAGYPDRTYRGNRALTRYEFAAGLNACLDRVNELIAAGTANLAKKEDLAALQKLQEQFAAELATLRGRVDGLTTKTATLEKQQFSTTTKLKGDVIFSFSGVQGSDKAGPANLVRSTTQLDENTTFSQRTRLSLVTSFTGKDQLVTRLQARNVPNFSAAAGTNNARLSYEGSGPSDNSVSVDKLYYRTTFGKASITLDAIGGEFYNNVPNGNPLLSSDSSGSISRFGRFNPLYRGGVTGAGITATLPLSEMFSVSAGYMVDTVTNAAGVPIGGAAFPSQKNGLFGGSNAFLAQINAKPIKDLSLGFTYVRSYDSSGNVGVTGATGSGYANTPFNSIALGNVPTSADNVGIEASYKFGPAVLSGWTGWTKAHAMKTNDITGLTGALKGDDASLFTWSVNLAFPDLGKKGNLAAIIVGQPPKVTKNDFGSGSSREDSRGTFHFEGLYRYAVNDKVAITPGFVILTNPEGRSNDTIYLGTIRTTFSF
jgi:Carbohydrate-selective porin, OprB family/S-layer homology domain